VLRILIISTFFPPLNSIASLRPYSWAKYWTLAGHHVEVLTVIKQQEPSLDLAFDNPGFIVHEVSLPKWIKQMKKKYHSADSLPTGRTSFFALLKKNIKTLFQSLREKTGILSSCRMPDLADFWIKPAFKSIKDKPCWDLVISTAGPYPVHIVASKLKKIGKAKIWIADYRDRWSDSCIYSGLFPFSLIERFQEKRILSHADLITTVSEPFAQFYRAKYGHKKVHAIENGMDPTDLKRLDPSSIFPQGEGKYRIVHTGSFYLGKRDPSTIFEAITLLNKDKENTHLLDRLELIFAGPNQANLDQLIEKYHVEKWVKSVGFVSRDTALRMQRDAQALLFFPWNDPKNDGNLTGKIFEYFYSKTPIMAVGAKELEVSQKLILEAKAGVILASTSDVMEHLKIELQKCETVKNEIAPDLLKRYDREVLAMKFLTLLK
jgi:glycosyltransferase involved in cell wall biosynthesis